MAHQKASIADADSLLPDDADARMFQLKGDLDTDELGFTVYQMEPDAVGMEHDHADGGQEEVYYVVEGGVDVVLGTETVSLDEGEALRVDATETRQITNRDHYSELVLAGAPI
ncbi:cupin domain-containing protein [Halobacterium yunchengense]|uniref:cupin domain-containing protein n=1 Tax=Halobacterium yunchengense TaxID=3108497 RepID=UPI00300807A3